MDEPRQSPARSNSRHAGSRLVSALSWAPALALGLALSAAHAGPAAPWAARGPSPWDAPVVKASAPGGATVGTIDVIKHLPGPALGKVTKGDAQVIILGAATPLPHLLAWDTLRLEHALDGADALYLEPRPSLSPLELVKLAVDRGPLQLNRGQTLQSVLPAAEKARYLRLLVSIHAKPQAYDSWKPAVAGLLLISDWRRAAGLSEGKPATTVTHLAEDAHVPVRYVGDFRLDPYVATVARLSAADNVACFAAAMNDVDQEAAHVRAMADAWAKADLKTVGATYKASLLTGCLQRIPSVQALLDRGTEQGVQTIEAALVKPGKSVAVIDLNFLLRPDGVLDRLKAQGAVISIPD